MVAATTLGALDMDILKGLLVRVFESISAESPDTVQRHMALLEEIHVDASQVQ